jgi:hypothetical protein
VANDLRTDLDQLLLRACQRPNVGHGYNSVLVSAANNAANAVIGALISSGDITAEVVAGGIIGAQALLQLLTVDCDGVVAALGFGFTAAELAQMVADPKTG